MLGGIAVSRYTLPASRHRLALVLRCEQGPTLRPQGSEMLQLGC